jgi:S-adenosylmethionine-dependent methyltransferase
LPVISTTYNWACQKEKRTLSPDYPRDPQQVYHWLEEIGWQIVGKTGVRVFHDYLREKRQQHDSFAALLELETRYCRQEPYISLGRYIHVTALSQAQAADARIKYE